MSTPWTPGQCVATDRQAEQMAAAAMRSMGFADAQETPVGPDGGVDVRSRRAIAQVKFRGAQTGRADVQRLVGARGREVLDLFFFTIAGYSARAVEYATEMDVALFTYDPTGALSPHSPAAVRHLQAAARPATPVPAAVPPSPGRVWWRRNRWKAVTVFCWASVVPLLVDAIRATAAGEDDPGWGNPPLALGIAVVGTLIWRRQARRRQERSSPRAQLHLPPRP
ncbi:restriction endonuclease [Cellulomonas hominis]|uniref:restriction endonuclease n=1 Tax=Cellulomonas hominis TaxID=156981 RepID=UPI0030B8326B